MGDPEYKKFENEVARIIRVLEVDSDSVEVDFKVEDPDFPGHLRQVDIFFERSGVRTFVECRNHKAKQDVKWIEELVGRSQSLRPDFIIGVSSSGFTRPAIVKAHAKGVLLRHLFDASDQEVAEWGRKAEFSVRFLRVVELVVTFVSEISIARGRAEEALAQISDSGALNAVLRGIAESTTDKLDIGDLRQVPIKFKTDRIEGFHVRYPEIESVRALFCFEVSESLFSAPSAKLFTEPLSGEIVASKVGFQSDTSELLKVRDTVFWHIDASSVSDIDDLIPTGEFRLSNSESIALGGVSLAGFPPKELRFSKVALAVARE